MKKLKFKIWSNLGDVLTIEELKHVCGGVTSGASEPISYFCVYDISNDPLTPHPYSASKFLIAYTNVNCISQCTRLCHTVGVSNCEAVCGYEMC